MTVNRLKRHAVEPVLLVYATLLLVGIVVVAAGWFTGNRVLLGVGLLLVPAGVLAGLVHILRIGSR